jgi:hypothetical protein
MILFIKFKQNNLILLYQIKKNKNFFHLIIFGSHFLLFLSKLIFFNYIHFLQNIYLSLFLNSCILFTNYI